MQGNREAPPAPHPSVVTYYPHGEGGRQAAIVFFPIAFLCLLHFGGRAFSETYLRCDRDVGLCFIEQHYPVGKTTSKTIPLATIAGVREESNHAHYRKNVRYLVLLGTSDGDIELADYDSEAEASQSAAALNGFFESSLPTMDEKCEAPAPFRALAFFLAAGLVLVTGFRFSVYSRVEALWETHTLRTTLVQWPFAPVVENIPIDAIEDVVVVQGVAQNGLFYGVSLIVSDRGDVPLVPQKSPSIQAAQRAVDEIHALLRIRDGGGLRAQYHV
jgi:hypothetical protein